MADIHNIISLGIGSPASIKQFLTLGLSPGAEVASGASFTDWLASPDRTEIALLELSPALHLTAWTVVGGGQPNTYSTPLARFEGTAIVPGGMYRRVDEVRQDATQLTARSSIVAVEANPGSYFWDEAAGLLYIRTSSSTPTSFTMSALVTFFVATQGLVLDVSNGNGDTGIYYQPMLMDGPPTISQEREDLFSGTKITATGELVLTNGHGLWNALVAPDSAYHWRNKKARLFIGGEYNGLRLARSQYAPFSTLLMENVDATELQCSIRVKPYVRQAEITLPVTPFFESSYPNLDPAVRGTKKALIYGRCAVPADLTDISGNGVYTVADAAFQTLFAVHTVWAVEKTTGIRSVLTLTTEYTVNLSACTITIVTAAYPHADYTIVAEVSGKPDGGGSYLKKTGEIIQDLLTTFLGVPTSVIDTGAFALADAQAPAEVALYLKSERSLTSILATDEPGFPSLERGVMGSVQHTLDGRYTFRVFQPWHGAATPVPLRKEELALFEPRPDAATQYPTTRVAYGNDFTRDGRENVESTDAAVKHLDESREVRTLRTFLRFKADADTLRQRCAFLTSVPTTRAAFRERGAKLALAMPGDKVLVTFSPAPAASGAYADTVFELTQIRRGVGSPLRVEGRLDLVRQLPGRVGTWMADGSPNWAAATAEQRMASGFWCNDSGRADAGDPASANVSLWW
jgi:hypothetical protein